MPDTPVVGVEPWGGRTRAIIVEHTGPASYVQGGESWPQQSVYGGPNSLGLSGINWTSSALSYSGNYRADPVYGGGGTRQNSKLKWTYSGAAGNGVVEVSGTGGSGMTAGTYALSFSGGGGSGAAGTITVATGSITSITITNPGTGYTSAPTVSAATGGTPPTLTALIGGVGGQEVAAGTNLSGETVRLLELGG